ncbi:retrovirus-related pol polyprotein from transposon TNT 1-94 [Tanacetum coccineum]
MPQLHNTPEPMTIPEPDGIELDVWNDGVFMHEPFRWSREGFSEVEKDYDLIHMHDLSKLYGGIELYFDHYDVGKGKEKVVVKSDSDSGNDWMLKESDNDHIDYSNKFFDYLSVGEEKLIQLITGQSNRIKTRQTLIPDMIGFASEGEDFNLQDPFVGVEERGDIYPTNDESTHWRMKIPKIKPQRPGLGQFGREAVENGFSECFKLTMLEAMRVIVLERLNTMRKISVTWTNDICPSIKKRIDLMKNEARRIQVKDIVKEVEDYLKTYSSARMDISWYVEGIRCGFKDSQRFLVFLDGLEPYLLNTLEDGPFIPLSNLSTSTNPLPKPHNQWSHAEARLANQDKRLKTYEGPSNTRDTKIAALRLKFNAFKALEGEKVNGTFTRLTCLLNDLENNDVIIPQAEVNATFVNRLPRKWLSMNQTQRDNNSIKNDSLATLYGKYNYEEGLIDQIYELETQRFTIRASSSKALISNNQFQDSDSDVEEDLRNSSEFIADLKAEYHERDLLANQKRFYKRSGRVGSARKLVDKSNEICFACGKQGNFQKECPSNKTSTPSYHSSNKSSKPSYPSSNKSYNKPKPFIHTSPQNIDNHQKDYKGKYKGLKTEMVVLTKKIDALSKGKSEKGLVAESFDWDEESISSKDKGTTKVKAFMAIAEDEPSVGKTYAISGQWVEITMKKVHRRLSMTDGDERKHVLDYTHVYLYFVEDQRKNLVNKFNLFKQDLSLHKFELCNLKYTVSIKCSLQNEVIRVNLENESLKDEIYDLKKVIEKCTCSKVTLDQLLSEQVPGNIVQALGGRGKRKEKISSKEVIFTKADEFSYVSIPEITSDSMSDCETQEPLPPLPKLIGAEPAGTLNSLISLADLTLNMADLTPNTYEHPEQTAIKKTLTKLKAQSSVNPSANKAPMILKPFKDCKYCRFNDHHFDNYEYYLGCEIYGSVSHETADCPKKHPNSRKPRIANRRSIKPTKK